MRKMCGEAQGLQRIFIGVQKEVDHYIWWPTTPALITHSTFSPFLQYFFGKVLLWYQDLKNIYKKKVEIWNEYSKNIIKVTSKIHSCDLLPTYYLRFIEIISKIYKVIPFIWHMLGLVTCHKLCLWGCMCLF